MDLTFNIIFVPGTVCYFRLAILSLLNYSPYSFRLVGNGLSSEEDEALRAFSASSSRLQYYRHSTDSPAPHGVVLNHLCDREEGDHFAFMDPDIFAVGPFQQELEEHLKDTDVFSSCFHLGLDPHEYKGYVGRCLQTPNGLELATTFFAVYHRETLHRVRKETGVGFELSPATHELSNQIRARLEPLNLPPFRYCDTGKLLNLLYHSYGLRMNYHLLNNLAHIGGVSSYSLQQKPAMRFWQKTSQAFARPYVLSDRRLEPKHYRLEKWLSVCQQRLDKLALIDQKRKRKRGHLLRHHIAAFFTAYFRSLFDDHPSPILALSDPHLSNRIRLLCDAIRQLHSKHAHSLAA